MKIPFILITYGFTQKVFSFEEGGIHKMPVFGDPTTAARFLESTKESMEDMLEDRDELQVQICVKLNHALDMFKMIVVINPEVIISYNTGSNIVLPDGQQTANREYQLDEWLELLEGLEDSEGSSGDSGAPNTPNP